MALSKIDLDRLDAAIATSELEITGSDGRKVRYRTIQEMIAARAHIASVISAATTTGGSSMGSGRSTYYPNCVMRRE